MAMAENIEKVLERGDKLENLVSKAAALSCDSMTFVRKCLYKVNRTIT